MTNSRTKGKTGEQEVCRIIRDELGIDVHRNWIEQSYHGGPDIIGVKGWSIEVKRAKVFRGDWWTQAATQAADRKEKPVLVYRLDRHDWRAVVCLCDISEYELHDRVDMEFRTWIYIVREQL